LFSFATVVPEKSEPGWDHERGRILPQPIRADNGERLKIRLIHMNL